MAIESINISDIRSRIDSQLGACELNIPGIDKEQIDTVIDSDQFDNYLQDQSILSKC